MPDVHWRAVQHVLKNDGFHYSRLITTAVITCFPPPIAQEGISQVLTMALRARMLC